VKVSEGTSGVKRPGNKKEPARGYNPPAGSTK